MGVALGLTTYLWIGQKIIMDIEGPLICRRGGCGTG